MTRLVASLVGARGRIIGLTVLVVALALAVTVVLLRQVLLAQLGDRVDESLVQEAREFEEFVAGQSSADDTPADEAAREVFERFLRTNVADANELVVSVQDGRPLLSSTVPPADLETVIAPFVDSLEPRLVDVTTEDGDARLLVQPLLDDGEQVGLLLVFWFLDAEREAIDDTIIDAALVALAALAAATALAWLVAGRVLRPVGELAATAREITEHDLSRRIPERGSDEMAAMVRSFNGMLDRLEDVVDRQRRFLDDAGHELRTPITVVRGHLELAPVDDDGSALLDADGRRTVLTELDRMTRIVDDLLVLAKAQQYEFLRTGPVDLDDLVRTVHHAAGRLGPQRWVVDAAPPAVFDADRDRLVQAMLNLAGNAARHTPADGEIGIGARVGTDEITLWVRDTGEGIEPADHGRVFERFGRATTQRSGGSAGLGLAIVRAIAEAHGGRATVESERGRGAIFSVIVPARSDDVAQDDDAAPGDDAGPAGAPDAGGADANTGDGSGAVGTPDRAPIDQEVAT